MKPSQSIEVQLIDEKREPLRLANVMIDLQFLVRGRFRYQFGLGLTDATGRVRASYSDFEDARRKNAELFLMDYNTKLEETDPRVKVLLPSDEDLRKREEYVKRVFGSSSPWKSWPSNVEVYPAQNVVDLSDGATIVQLQTGLGAGGPEAVS